MTLDAGPLIGLQRLDGIAWGWLEEARTNAEPITVPAVALAEVWRGGARMAPLVRALEGCWIDPCDESTARRAGELLARVGGSATIDALVVTSAAARGDFVVTGDPADLEPLGRAAGVPVFAMERPATP